MRATKKASVILIIGLLVIGSFNGIYYNKSTVAGQNSKNEINVPIWETGMQWVYTINEINIEIPEDYSPFPINIYGSFGEINLIVSDETTENYILSLETTMNGEVETHLDYDSTEIEGTIKTGRILKPKITGEAIVRKSDLGLKSLDLTIQGGLVIQISKPIRIPALRIPIKITLSTEFSNPFPFVDFPLSEGHGWGFPDTNISIDGSIQSIWLRPLNFINRIVRFFHLIPEQPELIQRISDMLYNILPIIDIGDLIDEINMIQTFITIPNPVSTPELPAVIYCVSYNTTTVEAGTFDSYGIIDVVYGGLINTSYAPEVKNIIKFSGNLQYFIPFLHSIDMELTTYSIPNIT